MRFRALLGLLLPGLLLALPAAAQPAFAQDVPATASDYGGVGLIEMRNARFRPDGTLEGGAAIRPQRRFWSLTFQALPFLETTFRLTDRLDATAGRGTTSDRAFDVKARLWEESAWRPALAMGAQDVIGTGLYAGEYLVASKRFWGLDMTLGLGWGRLGTGADFGNPLGAISGRYRVRPRHVGVGGTPGVTGLYRGRDAAVFGGLEWSVPPDWLPSDWALGLEGLRAKLEWSGDALRDERGGYPARTTGLRGAAASRLNFGLQWQPSPWVDAGVHFVHGTDLLLRFSLRLDPARPPALPRPPPPAMVARPEHGHHVVAGQESRRRQQAAAQRLAEHQAVRAYAVVVAGKQMTGTPEAGLDLVADQQHIMAAADGAALREVSVRRNDDAGLALYRLDQKGRGVRRNGGFQRGGIAEGHGDEARCERPESGAVLRFR